MSRKDALEPRKIPSQERSRKTMADIYKAAARIFTDIGYAEATTEQIAEKAGVSIGTLYHYFPGKEAVLHGLWEQHENEIKAIVQQIDKDVRRQGSVNRHIIPILLHMVLEIISYERLQNRLFISPIGLPEKIIEKRRELGAYLESSIEAVFRDFANVRIRNPKIGVHIIWATVQAVMLDFLLAKPEDIKPEILINELTDMMSRYVFADEDED